MAKNSSFLQSPFLDLTPDAKVLPGQQTVKPTVELPEVKQPQDAKQPATTSNYLPPADYVPIFEAAAREFDVPVNVLMALGHQESRYNPSAVGTTTQWGRAKGMMQYLDSTAKGLGINPFAPEEAIPAAARQIRERLDKGYSMEDAVKEHFAGPDRKLWGPKTDAYGREVMEKVGRIGEALGTSAPQSNLQNELDAEEPGRYRVINPGDERLLFRLQENFDAEQIAKNGLPQPEQAKALETGFIGRSGEAFQRGLDNTIQYLATARFAIGAGGDTGELAQALEKKFADEQKRAKTAGEKEIDEAFQRVTDAQGAWNTTVEGLKAIGTAITNPKDLAVGIIEQTPNMLPTLGAGAAGAGGGAAVGSIGGVPGAVTGAIIGGRAGMATGTTATELGAEIEEVILKRLTENKQAPTAANIKSLLDDETFRTEARNQGLKKGLTVAAVDQIFFGLTGRVGAKAAMAPTIGRKAALGTGAVALDATGEVVGEAASQQVARGEVDAGDALREGVYGLGQSVVEPVISAGARSAKAAADAMRGQPDAQATTPTTTPPAAPAPATEPRSTAPGPLSRSIENAANDSTSDQLPRVTVTAPEGQITGFMETYQEDGQGGFAARVLGDDGQVYNFTSADQVTITQDAPKAGPLTGAIEQAAESVVPETAPTATAVAPAAAPAVEAVPQPAPETVEQRLADMTEPQLRERLKYIANQAKTAGGWNKMFFEARREVEREINKRTAQQQETANAGVDTTGVRVRDDGTASTQAVAPMEPGEPAGSTASQKPAAGATPAAAGALPDAGTAVSGADQAADRKPALAGELAGAKPRYAYGAKQFDVAFASDIDKAAFIAAQKTPSKRDADYVKFVSDATGMTEEQVRAHGRKVRDAIKAQAKDAEPGTLAIAEVSMGQATPAADEAPVSDKAAGKWFGSKPKADAYIAKQGIAGTHEVVKAKNGRWEIKRKEVTDGNDNRTGGQPAGTEALGQEADAGQADATAVQPAAGPDEGQAEVGVTSNVAEREKPETQEEPTDGTQAAQAEQAEQGQPAEVPVSEAGVAQTPEQAIRAAFDALESPTIGSWHPITVTANGRTQQFLANMKKVNTSGKSLSAIHLVKIRVGRMIAGLDQQYIADYYKLDGQNKLTEEGLPSAPTEGQLARWKSAGFELPALENEAGVKREFTYKVKPTEGGYLIESDDGGGVVMSGRPNGPGASVTGSDLTAVDAAKYLKDFIYSLDQLHGMTDKAQVILSSELGKSGRDTQLMQAYGLTRDQAHDINNSLDSRKPYKMRRDDMQEAFRIFPELRKVIDAAIAEANGQNDELDAEMRSYEAKAEAQEAQNGTTPEFSKKWEALTADQQSEAFQAVGAIGTGVVKTTANDLPSNGITRKLVDLLASGWEPTKIEPQAKPLSEAIQKQFAQNKIFTADKVEAARARLRSKLTQFNSGIDPEVLVDGMTIAGAYIESGVRTFGDYAKAMTDDFGEAVKPYLLSFYEAVRNYPGVQTEGMSTVDEAKAEHAALMKAADTTEVTEAIGETVAKPAKRIKKTGARTDMTLTQDWGVDHIDGYGATFDRETGNDVKDAFLKEARTYLSAVAGALAAKGYTPYTDAKGRPEKPVTANESGVAGSGDVTMALDGPDDIGVYMQISGTSLRGAVPTTPSGISVLFRVARAGDKYGTKDRNRWMPVDLSASDLAELMDQAVAQAAKQPTMKPEDNQNAGTLQAESLPARDQGEAQDNAADGNRDREQMDLGLAGDGEGAAQGGRVPAGAQGPGTAGTRGAQQSGQQPPGATRDSAGVRTEPEPTGADTDFVIDAEDIGKGGLTKKYRDNVAAIRILKAMEAEGRLATPEERKQLAKYVGWGAMKGPFDPDNKQWAKQHAELKELLTPEEFRAARKSTLDAHYTSPIAVGAMYDVMARLGFNGGRVLEPSVGVGNFFGLMPASMRNASQLFGVELDSLTSRMVAALYPKANIAKAIGFEDFEVPAEYFDAVIGNPPFGSQPLVDAQRSPYSGFSIHNYFLAKGIDKLRPGGIMQVVVSHNFLDANDGRARKWISERADLIAGVRLPNTAFQENAGTQVVTDILVFKKREPGVAAKDLAWVNVGDQVNTNPKTGESATHKVNQFFLANPQFVLGTPSAGGTMYTANEYTVEANGDLKAQLSEWVKTLPENIYTPIARKAEAVTDMAVPDGVKVGSFYVDASGQIMQRGPDELGNKTAAAWTPPNAKAAERMKGMIALRDSLRSQMRLERSLDATQAAIEANRAELNRLYDTFLKQHGHINSQTNRRLFLDDTEAQLVQALEFDYDKGISKAVAEKEGIEPKDASAKKADIFERRVAFPPQDFLTVTTAKDALLSSLNYRGKVDPAYMAEVYGKSIDAIVKELGDVVYDDPVSGLVTADEYLSGDVKTKLAEAKAAGEKYRRNVEALEKVIPADKKPSEISVSIGAAFVPTDIYEQFVKHISGGEAKAAYVRATGQWLMDFKGGTEPALNTGKFGTDQLSAQELFQLSMLGRGAVVKKTIRNSDGSTTTILMEKETEAAREKQNAIKAEWQSWLWSDPARAEQIASIYNDKMNRIVERKYDGSHLSFPGMNPAISLLEHQKNGVWRGLQSYQVLYDHVVGAGKTFEMATLAMEMRRLGISRKPLFVVPNHLTLQWRSEFTRLYPGSNILAATPEDFSKDNRERLFSKIITGDWDAVVVGHSSLKKIGLPEATEKAVLQEQIDEIAASIEDMKRQRGDRNIIRDMEGIRSRLEARMKEKLSAIGTRSKVVTFDELGIDAMFVDEMHEFKNLAYMSTMDRNPGMGNPNGSAKAFDLFVKVRWLFDTFGEKTPFITATGTPVSNSLVEMYNMQRYMQYPTLKQEGLHVFDAWAKQFGNIENVYEVAPSGSGYRQSTRFGKFSNLPALMGLYNSFADTITLDDLKAQEEAQGKRFPVPKMVGGKPQIVVAQRSPAVASLMGVPMAQTNEDGSIKFLADLNAPVVIEQDANTGKWTAKVGESNLGQFETEQDARLKVVERAVTPEVTVAPESILGRFGRLRELTKETKGKVNALSLTSEANKAGLDYRLVNPAAPDFEGSKINLAVDNMVRIYKQWSGDKGAQLVFCDLSIPLSARADYSSKSRRLYVRNDAGAVEMKRGTMHTLEGHETLPYFVVQRGEKDTKRFDAYDAASGVRMVTDARTKQDAVADANAMLADENQRQAWINRREATGEITQEQIDEYNNDNDIEADGIEAFTREDIAGMSGASQFSVYDDIKAKLIAKGIPEREIAFIHDYSTPSAKDKLFKAVNSGDVRFLLGSTPKMGAGTNVQKRLVGLHHIDAPWRPSDLEQREGRIIRRGNELYDRDPEGFEVFVGRYATEQTYDTRRWQILEHKARGIEQLRNFDGSINEIDDIEGEAANAADMKAAASGDPLILEETRLRNDVRRLELLQAAHADDVLAMNRKAKSADDYAKTYGPRLLSEVRDLIQTADKNPLDKDGFAPITVDGKTFAEKESAQKEIFDAMSLVRSNLRRDASIVYRGITFEFSTYDTTVTADSPTGNIGTWQDSEPFSSSGFVQRMANYVSHLPAMAENIQGNIDKSTRDAAALREQAKQPFPQAADLVAAREEYKRVQRALLAKGPAVPESQKPAVAAGIQAQKARLEAIGFGDALREFFENTQDEARYSVRDDGMTVAEFGPVYAGLDAMNAIDRLMQEEGGEAIVNRQDLGEISLIYGNDNAGLKHIAGRRGAEILNRIPDLIANGKLYTKANQPNRVFIGNDRDEAVIRLDWNGQAKTWLLSAYEKYPSLETGNDVAVSRRSQTIAERTAPGLNTAEARQAVTAGLIGPVVNTLIENGFIVLHASTKTLPKGIGQNVRGIQAVTTPDGKVHLVANAVTSETARAVMLHEMFHRGGEALIGSAEWGKLMGRMGSLYRQSEQSTGKAKEFFDRARERVAAAKRQNAVATRMEVEEFAAYAIEEYERAPDSLPAAIRKWVEDFLGYVKAWMVKRYGKQLGRVTPAQLSALAKMAIMDVAAERRGEIFGPAATMFSATEPTNTPAFRRWFKNSKVVDAQGKPLVVYHGTASEFYTFSQGRSGFFFTDNREAAQAYADYNEDGNGDPRVVDAYLSIQNPLVLNRDWYEQNVLEENGDTNWEAVDIAVADAEEAGHDGLILRGFPDFAGMDGDRRIESEYDQYIAFRPEQIKSATGNNGNFDPTNPDIRYSVTPEQGEKAIEAADKALTEAPVKDDYIGRVVGDMNLFQKIVVYPRSIASVDRDFTPVYLTGVSQMETRDEIIADLGKDIHDYHHLPQAGKDAVNKVLELGRLTSQVYTASDLRKGVTNTGSRRVVVIGADGKPKSAEAPIHSLLSKKGDTLTLTDEEIQAYQGLRTMFDRALDMMRDQTLDELGFTELVGKPNAAQAIRDLITDNTPEDQAEKLRNIAKFVAEIEQAKRAGYVPFSRYGDYIVTVKEKTVDLEYQADGEGNYLIPNAPDAMAEDLLSLGAVQTDNGWRIRKDQKKAVEKLTEQTVYSAKVETGITDFMDERKAKKVDDIPAVRDAIEKARSEWVGDNPRRRIVAFRRVDTKAGGQVRLSEVDALAEIAQIDNATWDAIREQLADAIKSRGFRRHFFHSDNVPGYTADFERSISDYVIGMSGYLSRRQHMKQWERSVAGTSRKPKLYAYATKYRDYVNNPQEELALVRQIGFFSYIAGVVATAGVNLTQVPVMTLPTMMQFAPRHLVMREIARAYKDALKMLGRPGRVGLDMFDPAKAPADVRAALTDAWAEGAFVPLETLDLMMTARQRNVGARKGVKAFNTTTQVVSVAFTFAERLNRLVTFIAAARLSDKRVVREQAEKVLAKNALAKDTMLGKNWSQKNFAEWMVDETQYRMGKANRPEMMRGVGTAILQFKSFMLNTLETWYRQAATQGREGKLATLSSIAVVWALSGIWGMPGADDLRKLIEALYKQITSKDLDLKTELRAFIAEKSGSNAVAMAVNKGITYPMGLDMTRVGMGTIFPDSASSAAGIPFDMLVGRPKRSFEKASTGDYAGAVAELTPNFMKNVIVAGGWKSDGVRDKQGNRILTPEDLSSFDIAMRAAGFQPAIVTDIRDYEYAQRRQETAIDGLKRSYTAKIARTIAEMERTQDPAELKKLDTRLGEIYAEIDAHNAKADPEEIIKIGNKAVQNRIMREQEGVRATWGRERRQAREGAQNLRRLYGLDEDQE